MNYEEMIEELRLREEELQKIIDLPPVTDVMFADVVRLRNQRCENLRKSIKLLKGQLKQFSTTHIFVKKLREIVK